MPDWLLPLACLAVLITLGLLAVALRRPAAAPAAEGFMLLAGKLEALAGTASRHNPARAIPTTRNPAGSVTW